MTARDGGLVRMLHLATQALHQTKSIPEPIALSTIQDSVDPTYLKEFAAQTAGK